MGLYQFTFRFLLLAALLSNAGCLTSDQANDATKAIVTNEPSAISNLGNPNNSGNNISGNGITVSANGLQQATLVAGNAISCVKDLNAYFFCWGKGLGNVPVVTAWSNPQISEVKISQNGGHSCFKKVDNTLYCFGQNDFGQSGVNYTQSLEVQTPHLMTQLQNQSQPIVDFAVGFRHTCFIQNTLIDGVLYQALQCLGDNTFGQLSKSIDLNSVDYVLKTFQPLNVMVLSGQDLVTQVPLAASKVTAGQNHTCAIDSVSGYVYCWGYGGTIGNGNTLTTSTPTLLSFSNAPSTIGYKTMTAISAGANHTCSINSLGNLLCWGKNAYAQVSGSLANTTDKLSAMKINPANNSMQVVAVSAGKNHTCAIVKNNLNQFTNDLWCWGANDKYQVIDPAVGGAACNGSFCGFVKVLSTGVTSVTSGDSHTCAVQDGDLKCWGKDDFGQSGVATIAPPTVSEPRVLTPQTIIFGI